MARNGSECSCLGWLICCGVFTWVMILTYGILIFGTVMILLSGSDPDCSLQNIYVSALNKFENSSTDPKIDFDIYLSNSNQRVDIKFDAVNVTFYYPPNDVTSPIGNFSFPGFQLGSSDYTYLTNGVEPVELSGVPWADARAAASNGSAVFRVELATALRFYCCDKETMNIKKHMLVFGGNVEVNDLGKKVDKEDVQLHKSMGLHRQPGWVVFLIVLAFVFFLFLWCAISCILLICRKP